MAAPKVYAVIGQSKRLPPDYERVVRRLSDRELASELEAGRGLPGYQKAVSIEVDRRRGL